MAAGGSGRRRDPSRPARRDPGRPEVAGLRVPLAAVAAALLGLASASGARAGAAAGAEAGRSVFEAQCAVCHATEPEFHKAGPSLFGIYGRKAGSAPFFAGYRGLKGADWIWDDRTLDAWLADPRGMLGGRDTAMTLRMTDPDQRSAVIAYLRTLR